MVSEQPFAPSAINTIIFNASAKFGNYRADIKPLKVEGDESDQR